MYRQILKKGLGILLIVCLVLSVCPLSAFAEGTGDQPLLTEGQTEENLQKDPKPEHVKVEYVKVIFTDKEGNPHGYYKAVVEEGAKEIGGIDTREIEDGYALAGIAPDLTIKVDAKGEKVVKVLVKHQTAERITMIAGPEEAIEGSALLLQKLSLAKDGTITVPAGEQVFKAKKNYFVARIVATGFNGLANSFVVTPGSKLMVSADSPALRFEYEYREPEKRVVTFFAGPKEAVEGSGVETKSMELDEDGCIRVPESFEVFKAFKNYAVSSIKATGFNDREESFAVKPGDKLKVTGAAPVIRMDFTYRVQDVVRMKIGSETVVINDQNIKIDTPPMVKGGRTYVPFRAVAEAFNAKVTYNSETRKVTAELDGVTVEMTIDRSDYTVNGETRQMDAAPFVENARTMIPVRYVAEPFGIKVSPIFKEDGTTDGVVFVKEQ